ncbi:MAG TPA: class I SAM-dependent methyltransferase [Gemmatimonadales bacterium]|nr:class I SAM-dependent methyltransferase [Gemmatimonadales bacterium]
MTALSTPLAERVKAETARVRQAYARRRTQRLDRESSWTNPYYVNSRQEREREVLACLCGLRVPFSRARILEVGCGTGAWLRDFVRWGFAPENLWGIDLLPEFLVESRQRCAAGVHVQCQNVTDLAFRDGTFDIVLQSMLFTSLLDQHVRRLAARELLRVLAQHGTILWYDFYVSNPRNPDVRRVGRAEIGALFPGCRITLKRNTLAPPLARRIPARLSLLYHLLAHLPVLCTHYLGVIRPAAQ